MPDVGSLRIKASKQRNLPRDQRDYDLEDKAEEDLTAYVSIYLFLKCESFVFRSFHFL